MSNQFQPSADMQALADHYDDLTRKFEWEITLPEELRSVVMIASLEQQLHDCYEQMFALCKAA